jgi:hypothetical protein
MLPYTSRNLKLRPGRRPDGCAERQGLGERVAAKLRVVGGWRFARPGQQSARAMVQEQHLPNVRLVTQDNKTVPVYDDLVKDKKVIVNFPNTQQPENCSATTTNLANLQKLLKDRMGKDGTCTRSASTPRTRPSR